MEENATFDSLDQKVDWSRRGINTHIYDVFTERRREGREDTESLNKQNRTRTNPAARYGTFVCLFNTQYNIIALILKSLLLVYCLLKLLLDAANPCLAGQVSHTNIMNGFSIIRLIFSQY